MRLPLPRFVLHPLTAVIVSAVHVYPLAYGHLAELFGGDVAWTHVWKGFGALSGAYVFAALALRGRGGREVGAHEKAEGGLRPSAMIGYQEPVV